MISSQIYYLYKLFLHYFYNFLPSGQRFGQWIYAWLYTVYRVYKCQTKILQQSRPTKTSPGHDTNESLCNLRSSWDNIRRDIITYYILYSCRVCHEYTYIAQWARRLVPNRGEEGCNCRWSAADDGVVCMRVYTWNAGGPSWPTIVLINHRLYTKEMVF